MFLDLSVILHPPREDTPPQTDTPLWADTPPSDTTEYGQRGGGTHPTGVHTSSFFVLTSQDPTSSNYNLVLLF